MDRYRKLVVGLCGLGLSASVPLWAVEEQPARPPMLPPKPPAAVQPIPNVEPQKNTFEFRAKEMKWDEVFDWYSKTSGLTLITTLKPEKGAFTYTPPAGTKLTLEEIEDAINEALEIHKMVLVPRRLTFFIQSTDEPFDGRLTRTTLNELDRLSRGEFASVAVPLGKLKADDIVRDVKKLLGASGSLIHLDRSNSLLIQGRVGNLRQIVKLIRDVETADNDTPKSSQQKLYTVRFKEVAWDDVFAWYVKEMGCTLESASKPKGTFTCEPRVGLKLTSADVTDLINEELMKQRLILVRNQKTAAVVTDGKIDPKYCAAVQIKDLPTLGRSELVEIAFPLPYDLSAEDFADELKKVLTPFGTLVLAKGKWIIIRDTVENVTRIIKSFKACCAENELSSTGTRNR